MVASQVGLVDQSVNGILTKFVYFYTANGHKCRLSANDATQGGLARFSRHLARALSSSSALALSPNTATWQPR